MYAQTHEELEGEHWAPCVSLWSVLRFVPDRLPSTVTLRLN